MIEPFTVREGIWDAETKVGTVGQWRHTAIFPDRDGKESQATYCNNCGGPYTFGQFCAGCGLQQ